MSSQITHTTPDEETWGGGGGKDETERACVTNGKGRNTEGLRVAAKILTGKPEEKHEAV